MALGSVNVPGTAGTDVNETTALVHTLQGEVNTVKSNAEAALSKANSAFNLATQNKAAIEELSAVAAGVSFPFQNGVLTYTGSNLTPTWAGYDSNKLEIGGVTKSTNAGVYAATFTPKAGYSWIGGATGTISVQWSIQKAAGSLSLNKSSATLNASALTTTVTVTRAGNGAITATSSNTSIATVSVSGTTLTITANAKGTATITVNVAAGTNHNAPESKTINVTVDIPSETLAGNTPKQIRDAARAGTAANYWSVGDTVPIKLNGSIAGVTLNDTYYAYIIGFNHNSSIEGNNTVHFQFGKDKYNVSIAFLHPNMTNGGMSETSPGFKASDMSALCAQFLSIMPTEWQDIISPCTKYTNTTTPTSNKIWLLSEFEVTGRLEICNVTEGVYQKRYTYYANGNDITKFTHIAANNRRTCRWWTRSPATEDNKFCAIAGTVNTSSTALSSAVQSNYSCGFAPAFMVA